MMSQATQKYYKTIIHASPSEIMACVHTILYIVIIHVSLIVTIIYSSTVIPCRKDSTHLTVSCGGGGEGGYFDDCTRIHASILLVSTKSFPMM